MKYENDHGFHITVPTTVNASGDPAATILVQDEDGNVLLKQTLEGADPKRMTINKKFDYDMKRPVYLISVPIIDPVPGQPDAYTFAIPLGEDVPGEH
jgi:hypothetical protein